MLGKDHLTKIILAKFFSHTDSLSPVSDSRNALTTNTTNAVVIVCDYNGCAFRCCVLLSRRHVLFTALSGDNYL